MQRRTREPTPVTYEKKCEWCAEPFVTEYETKSYCSRSHKERARQARKHIRNGGQFKPLFSRRCAGCAIGFTTRSERKIYCSKECRDFYRNQMRDERDRQYRNAKTPAFKARIYFKSNGVCGICGLPIDTALTYPDPESLSLDHIIPRSKGGSHAASNLRATHLRCNVARGDRDAEPLIESATA